MTETARMFEVVTSFRVYGTPAPQGSKTAFVRGTKAVVVEGGSTSGRQKLSSWRAEVTREAGNVRPDEPMTGPVAVMITFYMPKPKSAPKSKLYCDKKPDLDKLIRSTLDGMTGVIFNDDGQVSEMMVKKIYATPEQPAGAEIDVLSIVT
jgi:crossover junction endodeoxyribonuclease RusA